MQFARAFNLAATAGTNYLRLTLKKGNVLKVINCFNGTTAWLRCNAAITKEGADDDDANTISLLHGIIQCGLKDVHWEGEIKLTAPYNQVIATLWDCEAGDQIWLTVGYE